MVTLPSLTDLGPDTVELTIRTPVLDNDGRPVLDAHRRPTRAERTVPKARCSVRVNDGTEELAGATVAVLRLRALLPVDDDTTALQSTDAVRFNDRLYELTMPGVRHDWLGGDASHVRITGIWSQDVSLGEQVVVIPAGARNDHGDYADDGNPIPLIARAVLTGTQTLRFGQGGPQQIPVTGGSMLARDYTVILDVDAPISDGDWIVVRGDECRALIGEQQTKWVERRQLVVHAQYRRGGLAG